MENASKALLIAGGMLLIILIMSLATFIFKKIGSQTSEFYKDMSDTEVYEFNQQFFNYERNDLRIQDIITLINLARDVNEREQMPSKIDVFLNGKKVELTGPDGINNNDIIKMLEDDLAEDYEFDEDNKIIKAKYSCRIDYADQSSYVGKIKITRL